MWLSEIRFLRLFCFELFGTLHSLHSSTFNFLSLNSCTFNFLFLNSSTFKFLFLHSCNLIFSPLLSCNFHLAILFSIALFRFWIVILCLIMFLLFAFSHMFISVLGVLTLILFTLLLILKV